jgi:replicative DNA helicase Mcm
MTAIQEKNFSFISEKFEIETASVSEAIRCNFGRKRVNGMIISISKLYKMISKIEFYCDNCQKLTELDFSPPVSDISNSEKRCDKCNRITKNTLNFQYKNAITIELQDTDTFNDIDRLSAILFDNDTEGIQVGENVVITGDIQIINNNNNNKKLIAYLYAELIQHITREEISLTKLDIDAIKRFSLKNDGQVIEKLIELFDPSIVGYEHVKKGLLMSAVNTSEITSKKEKIHELLIGDPGLGKSKLIERITKLVPNSLKVSTQNASGKSLTAIIDRTAENTFLRLGPIPQARGSICGANEIGRMALEDQGHLLDVMEEEEFTKTAYGFHTKIQSPTTIIASANPVNNSRWKDSNKIDLNEFPVLAPLLDRFDLKFSFKDKKDPKEIRSFGKKYSRILAKKAKG